MVPPDYRRAGLTTNPFDNVLPGSYLEWVEVPAALAAALAHRPFHVELVGDKGAGKSTLLRWVCGRTPGATYVYAAGSRLPAIAPDAAVVCVDEASNLSRRAQDELWARTARAGRSLLISTHHGLKPRFPALVSLRLEPLTGTGWVKRRVEAARCADPAEVDLVKLAAEVARCSTGLAYATQRVLYEVVENLARGVEPGAALADGWRRAREDPTVAPALAATPPAWPR